MTEVYISLDGLEYNKIEIDENDSVLMKYISKDLKDVSKVFAPFSQTINVKATPTNKKNLEFFGDTTVVRISPNNKYRCKIYTNGVLNLTGIIKVKECKYDNNILTDYSIEFGTFIRDLKKIIGDDLITDLGSFVASFGANDVEALMQGAYSGIVNSVPIKYFIPFMSNNRVWSFDRNQLSEYKDNISWLSSTNHGSDRYVRHSEVRPSITVSTILGLMKKKYGLNLQIPIENRSEYKDAYIYCNGDKFDNKMFGTFVAPNNIVNLDISALSKPELVPTPYKYVMTSENITNSFKITKNVVATGYENHCKIRVYIKNFADAGEAEQVGTVRVLRKTTNEVVFLKEFETVNSVLDINFDVEDSLFIDDNFEFIVQTSFSTLVRHNKVRIYTEQYYKRTFAGGIAQGVIAYYTNLFVYNDGQYTNFNKFSVDLIKSLPNTKVIDFLESLIKAFNLRIYDSSPNDSKLFLLTPSDVNTSGFEYSKLTIDYTRYVDKKSFLKKAINEYNYYSFKHNEGKYRSNVDYKKATNVGYGSTSYPSIEPEDVNKYEIETKFTIIPPVKVVNAPEILTTYGFNSSEPTINSNGSAIYEPNFNELTIFYKGEIAPLPDFVAVTSCIPSTGVPYIAKMTNYLPALPVNSEGKSLGFSILVYNSIQYTDTLFSREYVNEIIRLLNPNCLSQSYDLTLPLNELYLNYSDSEANLTPAGFRLQNDIIIGETLFSILEANIDIKKGKAQLTLLNY